MEEFRKFLISRVGEHWLKRLSDSDLKSIDNWARGCQTFKLKEDAPSYLRNIDDAVRGYCVAKEIYNKVEQK
jgi:hypothetical protein